jgi:hypothetical protein
MWMVFVLIIGPKVRKYTKTLTLEKDKAKQHKPNPKAVIFQRKMSCLMWDSNPRHSAF